MIKDTSLSAELEDEDQETLPTLTQAPLPISGFDLQSLLLALFRQAALQQ